MVGLFGTLGTATSGMSANQVALQTSSHNIANTNTDGYSRQRVLLQTSTPYSLTGVGTLGTGVQSGGVERIVDDFVRGQIRDSNSQYQFSNQKSDSLGQLEDMFNEPSDNGLLAQMSTLTSSWTQLANNPELGTDKTLVVQNASTFADTLRAMATNINQLKDDTVDSTAKGALDFNEKVKQLQDLNEQIYKLTSQGETPNDLLDSRDSVLKDLSGLASITVTTDKFGRAFVQSGGQDILTADSRATLSVVIGSQDGQSVIAAGGDAVNGKTTLSASYPQGTILLTKEGTDGQSEYSQLEMPSGTLGGLQDSINEIQDRLQELNDFAGTVAKTTNLIVTDGEQSTSGFFEIGADSASYAQNFQVSEAVMNDPTSIAAGKTGSAGDGSRALALSKLSTAKFGYPVSDEELSSYDPDTMQFTQETTGKNFADAFNNMVTKNGISKQQADNTSAAQLSVLNQLEYKNESTSGVSLNEEMSDVIRFQQGFQANARILSVVSEMLDTLINRTGA
ncbi:flagellar hook-associated protein FlgK [Liquorilactobacillus oeni]|uniref:Flagellar hook-associated protein 1 n=2 Tax=Liquorilactobacillus oeni TaxID=303241 RepID=A0A0R1MCC8_9LACO|nr:flagellar hook-associated protein FlgK [Liquorilactobacillus oeni]AJA34175.1 flagellar hook-associated protein 1 FlgK [Liquorilactobacillus oeni]KRL05481.1 flagellar hook associated protein [Liquorilactobacillus oeni DSM 19972]